MTHEQIPQAYELNVPIQVFLHEGDYLRNYAKARKAERRGDPVEAAKWYRVSRECLRAAMLMNQMHTAVYQAGALHVRGMECLTELDGRKFKPGYAKRDKNPPWQKGVRRRHFWVVRTKE